MEELLSKEVAKKELNAWFDFHEINEDQKKDLEANVNIMLAGLQSGRIVIDSATSKLTQKLKHPIGKEKTISELVYTSGGLAVSEVENNKTNISKDNENRNSLAHIAVATNTSVDIISKMSTKDLNTAAAIIIFFIV